jgi:anti-sigma factor RsiW
MIRSMLRQRRMPPDCRQVAQVLQSYLDGELPPSRTQEVAEHLEHCERCGIEEDVYLRVKESLGQLAVAPDPEALRRLRDAADALMADDGS